MVLDCFWCCDFWYWFCFGGGCVVGLVVVGGICVGSVWYGFCIFFVLGVGC